MQDRVCAVCGNPVREGDNFCRTCGAPVRNIYENGAGADPGWMPEREPDIQPAMNFVRNAEIILSFSDLIEGCTKIVDFGTGQRFAISIPAGLSGGDRIIVSDTGITDPETGEMCDFELTVRME